MTITISSQGAERKRLVQTVSNWLGVPAKYCGAPTFNYEVDSFTIDRNGSLSFDDRADSEVIERLLQHIHDEGFDIDQSHTEDEPCGICISMPRSLFTDSNLENLKALHCCQGWSYQEGPRCGRPATGNHGHEGVLPLVPRNTHAGRDECLRHIHLQAVQDGSEPKSRQFFRKACRQ